MKIEKKSRSASKEFLDSVKRSGKESFILRLYVTGITQQSLKAITNIKNICEEHLKGRYELEVIDLYEKPGLASGEQIIATPTLIRKLPLPLRRIIGDMSNTDKVLVGLELRPID